MAIYSIKDLEKLSGIKAHTLRIWEKRYGIIQPRRTDTNIRYYLDEDLKRLLNIALLNRYGVKISKIATMDDEEIEMQVTRISGQTNEYDVQLDALTISMIEMDESRFDRIIRQNVGQIGFERTMMEVIYPFLDKLGVLWFTGSLNAAQESFMANLIRQKLYVAIDGLDTGSGREMKKFLLFLPEGETQELSLLFLHYMLKSRKYNVVNIGMNLTLEDVRDAYEIHRPDFIFTIINEPRQRQGVQDYVSRLSAFFSETRILLSGYQIAQQNIRAAKNYFVLRSLEEVLHYIEADQHKDMPGESLQKR